MAGTFLAHIERARAASQPTRPTQKPAEEMSNAELDEALRLAKVEVIEANKAVAETVAAERSRPPATLAAVLGDLKRNRRRRIR